MLLSSRPIPGNERSVSNLINGLLGAGAHVLHAGIEPGLHVSGHAARAQQRAMIEAVRPRHLVPIHGELRQLTAHVDLARQAGFGAEQVLLARDGDVLGFSGGQGAFWGRAHVGRVFESRVGGGDIAPEAPPQVEQLLTKMFQFGLGHGALALSKVDDKSLNPHPAGRAAPVGHR